MTLAKVRPGQPLRIPADTFNAFVDAAAAFQATRTSRQAEGGASTSIAGVVTVRNDTGADQERFAVLGIGTPLILPSENPAAFQERIALSVVLPDADQHRDRLCILHEPIAAGSLGRGCILGVSPVRLDVQDAAHRMAGVVTGSTAGLQSADTGGARILWQEGTTGPGWAIVQIPASAPASGDGGAPNLVLTLTATDHSFLVGDVLRWDGTTWVLAEANGVAATDTLAVVGRIPDADTALLVLWGIFCLEGLDAHTDYWLDPATPGGLTTTKPSDRPLLVLHHAQDGLCVLRTGSGGGGGGGGGYDDPVPAHQVLAGPASGSDSVPAFRDLEIGDLAAVAGPCVLAQPAAGSQRPLPLAAPADDQVLLRLAGTLQWAQIPGAAIADGAIHDAHIAAMAWGKLVEVPDTASRWPTWDEVSGKPAGLPVLPHDHTLGGDLTGTLGAARIADGAVTDAAIAAVSWGKLTGVPAQFPPLDHGHTLAGAVTGTLNATHIAAGAVGTAALANGAVTSAKLAVDFLTIDGVDYHLGDEVTGLLTNPMTIAGDLIVGGVDGEPTRLPVNEGGSLQILTSKSGQTRLQEHVLDALEDVAITAPEDQQVLTFDAATSQWVNRAPTGGGGVGLGSHPALVGRITGKVSGTTYSITLFPEYPSQAVAWVTTATQLQGDPTATIPSNTWTIAAGVRKAGQPGTAVSDYDIFIQVPIWM